MEQGVLKISDLNPDGVRIIVAWDELVVGASVFIPCINTEEAMKQRIIIFCTLHFRFHYVPPASQSAMIIAAFRRACAG